MIVLILSLIVFTLANAYYHAYLIEEKSISPNHTTWALIRLTFFALNAFIYSTEWDHLLALILLQSAIFWLLFDYTLNVMRGLPWDYVGKTAWIDRLFEGKTSLMIPVKIILLFLSIAVTVIIL